MKKKLTTLHFLGSDHLCDLFNAMNETEGDFISEALSIPVIKRKFKEHLKEAGIEEGITEITIEADFMDWFIDMMEDQEITISFDISHFREY